MASHSSTLGWKIPWMEEPGTPPWLTTCQPCSLTWLSDFIFTFHFHALEKEMATHSSVLAWRIPGTGEPGGLPSVGLHRVGQDWLDLAAVVLASRVGVLVAQSCPTLCNLMDCSPPALCPWNSPGKNTEVGCYSLLQGICSTQGSNLHLLCLLCNRQILYHLSHWRIPN